MLDPTALIYSSHNRCEYLHRTFIIERALRSRDNKTILFLPMSMRERHQQDYGYGTFNWYFRRFEQYGLQYSPFFWDDHLRPEDVDVLFDKLEHSQVVILGGGSSELGLWRFKYLGHHFYRDADLFEKVLHERQRRGLLTAGFSAGADQLSQYLHGSIYDEVDDPHGFGLARNVLVTLHHEPAKDEELRYGAGRLPHCMLFGLPNDSGIAVSQGRLASGNFWQMIEFVIDMSWDLPKDSWHVKTRMGQRIEHCYADGRHWTFNGGEKMLRVMSPDGRWQDAWLVLHNRPILHYGSQLPTFFSSLDEILRAH